MEIRLSDVPDWGYVFQEIDQVYRLGSAGGSTIIQEPSAACARGHQ